MRQRFCPLENMGTMTASTTQPNVRLDPRVRRRLRRLGVAIRVRLLLRGLGWFVLGLVAAAVVSFVVDYGLYRLTRQHLTQLQRVLINGLCLAGVSALVWRQLLRPQTRVFSGIDLAMVVERANPGLQDRLLSAMTFDDVASRPAGNVSGELMDAVIEQANTATGDLTFGTVLRGDAVRRVLIRAFLCAAIAAGIVTWQWEVARPWLLRNLLLRNVTYPRRTVLTVEGGDPQRVVRGGALTVVVHADPRRVVPETVTYHMRFPSLGDLVETVKSTADAPARFVKVFPAVTEPFTFFVTGNDDRTTRFRVELVEPPALTDVRFMIVAPAYTRMAPVTVNATEGALNVPEGSRITLAAAATKDLASATVFIDGEPIGACRVVTPEGGAPRTVEGDFQVRTPEPFQPRLNLRIALTDTQGFENRSAAAFNR